MAGLSKNLGFGEDMDKILNISNISTEFYLYFEVYTGTLIVWAPIRRFFINEIEVLGKS